jgi:hypothetical protein
VTQQFDRFIAGEFGQAGARFESINPASGRAWAADYSDYESCWE